MDKDLEAIKTHLEEGEHILAAVQGQNVKTAGGKEGGMRGGTLAATDRRVVFYRKNMGGFDFETITYETITSVERGKTFSGAHIRMTVAGNALEMKWIKTGDPDGVALAIRERVGHGATAPAVATAPNAAPAPDLVEQLRALAGLRDDGILTEDEFSAKKAELLAKP